MAATVAVMTYLPLFTRARVLLCAATLGAAALAGCTNGGSVASSPGGAVASPIAASGGAISFEAQSLAVGRRFAQCARDNGDADFPDPLIGNGALTWPGATKGDILAAEVHCAHITRELSTIPQVAEPPSAETLNHMRQFAGCMRAHGVPDWPDPKADGTFPLLGTPLRGMARFSAEPVPQHVTDARAACAPYELEWRIAAS